MARRASSGVNTQALLTGAVILILAIGGGYWFLTKKPEGFKAEAVNMDQYLRNQQASVGNEVQATGILEDRHNKGDAQMVILKIEENGSSSFLPILVPSELNKVNLNLQQEYSFLLRFNSDGLAVASDVKAL